MRVEEGSEERALAPVAEDSMEAMSLVVSEGRETVAFLAETAGRHFTQYQVRINRLEMVQKLWQRLQPLLI